MEINLNQIDLSLSSSFCTQIDNVLYSCLESRVAHVVFAVLAGGLIGATLATAFAMAAIPFTAVVLAAGTLSGGAVLLHGYFSVREGEALDELALVEQVFSTSPRMVEATEVVRTFFRASPIHLQQSYDYHHFHHALTVITEQVKTRADLRQTWGVFLNRIEGMQVFQPDGRAILLHTDLERERLQGRNIEVITDLLDPRSVRFAQDCEQLFAIEGECFAGNTVMSRTTLVQQWQRPDTTVHLARRRDTGDVLGYVWVREERDTSNHSRLHVFSVGRRAEACSMGLAERLFQRMFAQPMNRFRSVYLEVRESNRDAIALYSRWGFNRTQTRPNYYTAPLENAHVMSFVPNVVT